MKNSLPPPGWADKWLQWRLSEEQYEEVQGDMQELYAHWVKVKGEKKARRLYVLTALTFMRPLPARRNPSLQTHRYLQTNPLDMLQNMFILALRNFLKNKLHASINILGMAVAITSILLIALYVQHELSYDHFHKNLNRIVILGEQSPDEHEPSYVSVFPALPVLLSNYPELANGTRIFNQQFNWIRYGEKEFEERITFVDTGFFDVFTFPLQKGDVTTALTDPSSVVLSAETAAKLFGETDPIGQPVSFDNGRQLIVRGVLAPVAENSSIQPSVIIPIVNLAEFAPWTKNNADWYNSFTSTFLLLAPAADAKKVEAQLPGFVQNYFSEGAKERVLRLVPFQTYHKSQADNTIYIYGLSCVAIFLVLVACINFTNLSIATSLTRLREVAVRKTLGSSRRQLVLQFLTEACMASILSLGIGLLLTNMVLPVLNSLFEMKLRLDVLSNPWHAVLLLGLSLGMGIMAGIYPSLYLSALKPIQGLKGKTPNRPTHGKVRHGLVVVQFAIAVFLVTGTLLVHDQIQFMKKADLRFDQENVLAIDLNLGYKEEKKAKAQINFILNGLRNRPEVASISTSKNIPGRYWHNYNGYLPEAGAKEAVSLRMTDVDEGYLQTYGIRLIEGRNFSASIATDTLQSVIINRAAMQAFGWQTAVGKKLYDKGSDQVWHIVGVMDDFHYQSLQGKVEPLIHFFTGPSRVENNNFLSIKVKPSQAASVIAYLQEAWQQVPSRKEFSYFFVDEEFNKQYISVERSLSLISFFTVVTIVIACAGVFALSSLATQLRSKEIGIRKVLGAGVSGIVRLFFKDYLQLMLIANLVAWPLVYYAIQVWLENFAYQAEISPWKFGLSSSITVAIALLTISYQTLKAALADPVQSLRNE